MPYIIALDTGTSSIRAAAIDRQGTVNALHQLPFAPQRKAAGSSEYDAAKLLAAQLTVLNGLLDEIGPENAQCLALSSQRSSVVLWDKTTGRAVAPVLTWEDGRAATEAAQNPITQEEVHQLTGLYKTPFFSAPKIAWCLKNYLPAQQALKKGTLCAAPLACFLIFHLTQGRTFATDFTLAQRMLLLDIHTLAWSEKLCTSFQIPLTCLPQLKPSAADYGTYMYKGSSIPISVCAADQQAASSFLQEGQACINYGTGAFVLRHTGAVCKLCGGLLTSLSVSSGEMRPQFLLEGPVNAAGSAFLWLAKQGIALDMAHLDELCAHAAQPVSVLPALGGLGAPYWNFDVSPVAAGLSPRTTPADWAAGLAQSIAFLVADIAQYLKNQNAALNEVFVSGGLSKSRYLVQFQSDILQLLLQVQTQTEGTLLGLARLVSPFETAQAKPVCPSISAQEALTRYAAWRTFFEWATRYIAR